jgi:hypothetical protein
LVKHTSWYADFASTDLSYLQLICSVLGASNNMIINIYASHDTSSFINNLSHNSYWFDCFLAAAGKSDVSPFIHLTFLDVLVDHILV